MKYLTIYPEDFRCIEDWYAICDQLEVPHNSLIIDIELTKVAYADYEFEKVIVNY